MHALNNILAFLILPCAELLLTWAEVFFGINSNINNGYTAACNLTNGAITTWNPVIPVYNWNARTRISVEYYRDSLYLGVFDASAQRNNRFYRPRKVPLANKINHTIF
ncbi:MAG: hypothetical protein ABIQ40_16665 [Bacteroidia bacterium]